VQMSIPQMREAAKLGAYLELVYGPFNEASLQRSAEVIQAVGAASIVLSSDLGQANNPLHPDGLMAMYKGLVAHGIPVAEIDQMAKANPAKLLGLKP